MTTSLDNFGSGRETGETRLLQMIIRVGEVTTIDPVRHTCRVVFPEHENCTSFNLPVIVPNTYENHDYAMPDIGEDVLCIFRPDGPEDGFVLGSFYAEGISPPTSNPDQRMTEFKDGTIFRYDRVEHAYDIIIEGTTIHADRKTIKTHAAETQEHSSPSGHKRSDDTKIEDNTKDYTLTAGQSITENAGTSITITAGQDVKIVSSTQIVLEAPQVTINAPQTTINGNLTQPQGAARAGVHAELQGTLHVRETITTDADVQAAVSLNSHTHTGVHGETSGPH